MRVRCTHCGKYSPKIEGYMEMEREQIGRWLRVPVMGHRQWEHNALAEMIEKSHHWLPGQGVDPPERRLRKPLIIRLREWFA